MLKRILSIIMTVSICLSATLYPAAYTETVTEKTNVPPKTVFLGDSIAAGMGLEGYSQDNVYNCESYANILGRQYKKELEGKCEAVMVNKAVSGEATYDLLDHIQKGEFDSTLKDSSAVVISIGANDMINVVIRDIVDDVGYDVTQGVKSIKVSPQTMFKVIKDVTFASGKVDKALETCRKNLSTIIKEIKNRTKAPIIVQTVYNPMGQLDKYTFIRDYTNKKLKKLNEIIVDNSDNGKNYTICDIASQFEGRSNELTNIEKMDIHPNAEGHRLIAESVDKIIRTKTYTYEKKIEIPDSDLDLKNSDNQENQAGTVLTVISAVMVSSAVVLVVVRKVIACKRKSSSEK